MNHKSHSSSGYKPKGQDSLKTKQIKFPLEFLPNLPWTDSEGMIKEETAFISINSFSAFGNQDPKMKEKQKTI